MESRHKPPHYKSKSKVVGTSWRIKRRAFQISTTWETGRILTAVLPCNTTSMNIFYSPQNMQNFPATRQVGFALSVIHAMFFFRIGRSWPWLVVMTQKKFHCFQHYSWLQKVAESVWKPSALCDTTLGRTVWNNQAKSAGSAWSTALAGPLQRRIPSMNSSKVTFNQQEHSQAMARYFWPMCSCLARRPSKGALQQHGRHRQTMSHENKSIQNFRTWPRLHEAVCASGFSILVGQHHSGPICCPCCYCVFKQAWPGSNSALAVHRRSASPSPLSSKWNKAVPSWTSSSNVCKCAMTCGSAITALSALLL